MNRRRIVTSIACFLVACFVAIGIRIIDQSAAIAQSNTTLLVSAAASLRDVLQQVGSTYQQTKPNLKIRYNFGASGALQQQIEQGAPVDIFISAATRQIDALDQKGRLMSETRTILATNRLVLIVPAGKQGVNSFSDLTRSNIKRIAIGEPRSVPAGQYAEQVLQKLGIYNQVKSKFVYANNVRQVLAAVESGNADAGMVYITDAKISNKVKIVATADRSSHSPITYPAAVLKRSKNAGAAREFLQYLRSNQAQSVFRKSGFGSP
jgi:molybdate transport system substrate-binding protein